MSQDPTAIWDAAVNRQRDRIRSAKLALLVVELDYANFQKNLRRLQDSFENRTVTKSLLKLSSAFERLNAFEQAFVAFSQVDASTTLIWGILQSLLRCACSVISTLDSFTAVLYDLTFNLTRINKYLQLLPTHETLKSLSCTIFDEYLQCCISAIKFYRRHPLTSIAKAFFLDPQKPLQDAHDRIKDKISWFEKEIRDTIDARILERLQSPEGEHETAPEPGIFDVPFMRNEYFHGREDVLSNMHSRLHTEKAQLELRSCLVHAMGGMGKTQVALEYAYRYRHQYRCIFWLGSERSTSLAVSFAAIATKLTQLTQYANMGQGRRVEIVKTWLETTDISWLLIFDNVESRESIMPFYPTSNGSVILTSQIQALSHIFRFHIKLQPMPTVEGAELLLKYLHLKEDDAPTEEVSAANKTVNLLGGMPIAIAHIAGVMFDSQMTISEAISGLEKGQQHLLWASDDPLSTHMYEKRLNEVWHLALNELSPEALDLLYLLSMLNADKIQELIFTSGAPLKYNCEIPSSSFPNLRAQLARKQLVQRHVGADLPYLSIHRSFQLNIRHVVNKDRLKRQAVFSQAVALLRRALPPQHVTQTPSNENWNKYEEYHPHILSLKAVFEQSVPSLHAPPELAGLLSDAANYFWELGKYGHSQKMASLSVSIFEQLAHPNLMELASAYALWGEAAAEEGIIGRDIWLRCSTKAVQLRKSFLQTPPVGGTYEDLLLYANSYNDFGAYLIHAGNYEQAETYIKHSLTIKAALSTEATEPMMFAEGYQNLAVIHAARKEHKKAAELIHLSVDLGTKANGPDAAATWTFHFDCANLALSRGDHKTALPQHLEVLDRRKEIFGKHGCRTRDSYHAVAVSYFGLQLYDESEKYLKIALENLQDYPWHDSGVARSKYLLAQACRLRSGSHHAEELEHEATLMANELLPDPSILLDKPVTEKSFLYDYMVCYRAGRPSLGQITIKPFDPIKAGIDPTIIMPSELDTSLPIHAAGDRSNEPAGLDQ